MESYALIPLVIVLIIGYAALKKVPVYEAFVEGAKEGFDVSVRIIPYLVAMLVAVSMFRASGAMELLGKALSPFLDRIHMPADLIPFALTRSLSGSGAAGLFTEIVAHYGSEHPVTKTAAIMMGSTETTFYVLAVYFGAVGVKKYRHAVAAGIFADLASIFLALFVAHILFY